MANPPGFPEVRAHSAATFDLDARLPNQVFRGDVGSSLFCEFDAVLAPDFWPALRAMARWHDEDYVELLVLEPDGDSYPVVSLPVGSSSDDYWTAIGFEPDGDVLGSITISANVIAVTGPSGKWGCWGERYSEVAVFRGFPDADKENAWRTRYGPFLKVSEALKSYLPFSFAGWVVPDEYAATLIANYA